MLHTKKGAKIRFPGKNLTQTALFQSFCQVERLHEKDPAIFGWVNVI